MASAAPRLAACRVQRSGCAQRRMKAPGPERRRAFEPGTGQSKRPADVASVSPSLLRMWAGRAPLGGNRGTERRVRIGGKGRGAGAGLCLLCEGDRLAVDIGLESARLLFRCYLAPRRASKQDMAYRWAMADLRHRTEAVLEQSSLSQLYRQRTNVRCCCTAPEPRSLAQWIAPALCTSAARWPAPPRRRAQPRERRTCVLLLHSSKILQK